MTSDATSRLRRTLRAKWVRPVALIAISLIVGWFIIRFVGKVSWSAVGDAIRSVEAWELLVLILMLLVRQVVNALPIARFTPGLRVLPLARGRERRLLRRAASDHDVIVTSYALLRRDLEAWKEVPLGAVILDEAQNIKNPDTAIAHAVRELAAPHRLALTGTPLENRALDLWSIMSFLNPGYLGSRARFSSTMRMMPSAARRSA